MVVIGLSPRSKAHARPGVAYRTGPRYRGPPGADWLAPRRPANPDTHHSKTGRAACHACRHPIYGAVRRVREAPGVSARTQMGAPAGRTLNRGAGSDQAVSVSTAL